jgi:transposase
VASHWRSRKPRTRKRGLRVCNHPKPAKPRKAPEMHFETCTQSTVETLIQTPAAMALTPKGHVAVQIYRLRRSLDELSAADNLSAYHGSAVRAAIEARGAELRYLPPYSPDLNPIEEAFSKVKQALRRAQARTDDALREATWQAFATITPADAAGWFAHCGYGSDDQAS